ncbi:MAG: RluA family pseudouridine synthase [Bdellovibrionales bacterium]|nr:RluA family pseudouridine synthase [Bdellovibrionales bacterium]
MPHSPVLSETLELTLEGPLDRLDVALLSALKAQEGIFTSLSRAQLKSWFHEKRIRQTAPHRRTAQASDSLGTGQSVRLEILYRKDELEIRAEGLIAKKIELPVIFEDPSLLIVHKRSGVPSVPQAPDESETAVGFALARTPGIFKVGTEDGPGRTALESGVLHRLDTGTSGLLVFAKNNPAFSTLRQAWKAGDVRKKYRALVRLETELDLDQVPREIRFDLGHDPKSKKKMLALTSEDLKIRGKPLPAVTLIHQVRPIPKRTGPFFDYDLEIEIQTGVMHQIRCHLASIGLPILGDRVYGNQPASRLFLHAWRLSLPHPESQGLRIDVEAMLPWVTAPVAP